MIFITMNLNEQISRIVNLMYEQPQIKINYNGEYEDDYGKTIEFKTNDDDLIGVVSLTTMENGKKIDPDFIKVFDESKFQTLPLNYDNSLFLHSLNVEDKYKRQGYGSQILNKCHELAKDKGYDFMSLITDTSNVPAQDFYNKFGYKILNDKDKFIFYFVEL